MGMKKSHQSTCGLTCFTVITAHIAQPSGMLQIRIYRNHGNTFLCQFFQFLCHRRMIKRGDGQSLNTFFYQLIDQLDLPCPRVILNTAGSFQHSNAKIFKFCLFFLYALQHFCKKRISCSSLENQITKFYIFTADGKGTTYTVGHIPHRIHDRLYLSGSLLADTAAMIQHTVHRSPGYTRHLRYLFQCNHNLLSVIIW